MTEQTAKATRTRTAPTAREPHRRRRELVELAAPSLAVAPLVLLATVAFHTLLGRDRRYQDPLRDADRYL